MPLKRAKFTADKTALAALVAREEVRGIVAGLPLALDGKDTPRTQATRAYARNLGILGLPLLLWDERWSTAAVERQMIAADVSRARRAAQVDSAAAAFILQGAIDRLTAF
jgi:putative holliday junction resolvase